MLILVSLVHKTFFHSICVSALYILHILTRLSDSNWWWWVCILRQTHACVSTHAYVHILSCIEWIIYYILYIWLTFTRVTSKTFLNVSWLTLSSLSLIYKIELISQIIDLLIDCRLECLLLPASYSSVKRTRSLGLDIHYIPMFCTFCSTNHPAEVISQFMYCITL